VGEETGDLASGIDADADQAGLISAADAAASAWEALAARQAEAVECVSQELLCSPEITRCVRVWRSVRRQRRWSRACESVAGREAEPPGGQNPKP
jgi:hypothetical protein